MELIPYSDADIALTEALECDPRMMGELGGPVDPAEISAVHRKRLRTVADGEWWFKIEWTSTVDGTIIGTGGHLHPGGMRVVAENYGSKKHPCRDDGRGYGGTTLLASDAVFRNAPYSEDFQMEVSDPRWRAPIHKGDRIRISGTYENKKHSWYEVMTHEGFYIDTQQKPKRGCAPYLLGQSRKPPARVKLEKLSGVPELFFKRNTAPPTGRKRGWVDPTEGIANRKWGEEHDEWCGARWDGPPCERDLPKEQAAGGLPSAGGVHIADFLYTPGDRALSPPVGAPVQVKKGTSLTFYNEDAALGIRHTVTTCAWPCNGPYVRLALQRPLRRQLPAGGRGLGPRACSASASTRSTSRSALPG